MKCFLVLCLAIPTFALASDVVDQSKWSESKEAYSILQKFNVLNPDTGEVIKTLQQTRFTIFGEAAKNIAESHPNAIKMGNTKTYITATRANITCFKDQEKDENSCSINFISEVK